MKRFLSCAWTASLLTAACGGGGSPSTPSGPPSGTTSETVSTTVTGTTRQTAPGSCTSDSHNFTAAAGEVKVVLLETSDPAGALAVQVCGGGIDNNNCTINLTKISVGQTLTGSRIGIADQTLKFLPHNCVFGGQTLTEAVTYRASLTHQR